MDRNVLMFFVLVRTESGTQTANTDTSSIKIYSKKKRNYIEK